MQKITVVFAYLCRNGQLTKSAQGGFALRAEIPINGYFPFVVFLRIFAADLMHTPYMMKLYKLFSILALLLATLSLHAQDVPAKFAPIQHAGDTLIICTKTFGKDIRGFQRDTPVKIYLLKEKVVKVEAMTNRETREYFAPVKEKLLHVWNGLTVKEAKAKKVDVVTEATVSSRAIIETVHRGLEYYESHK